MKISVKKQTVPNTNLNAYHLSAVHGLTLTTTAKASAAYTYKSGSKLTEVQREHANKIFAELAKINFNKHVIRWSAGYSEDNHILAWGEVQTNIASFKNKLRTNTTIQGLITQQDYPNLYQFISDSEVILGTKKISLLEEEFIALWKSQRKHLPQGLNNLLDELCFDIGSAARDQKTDAYLLAEILYAYTLSSRTENTHDAKLPTRVSKAKNSGNPVLFIPRLDKLTVDDIAGLKDYLNLRFCFESYNDDICHLALLEDIQPFNELTKKARDIADKNTERFTQRLFKRVETLKNTEAKNKTSLPMPDSSWRGFANTTSDESVIFSEERYQAILCKYFDEKNILYSSLAKLDSIKDYRYLDKSIKNGFIAFKAFDPKKVYFVATNFESLKIPRQVAAFASGLIGNWAIKACNENDFVLTLACVPEFFSFIENNVASDVKESIRYDSSTEAFEIHMNADVPESKKLILLLELNKTILEWSSLEQEQENQDLAKLRP